ncbi:polyketide synthase [Fusarium albosuccineum]|uniref:Polyketide synthase n=1 Tax=Fusarium albosuccineum TaxID=1237068 RepID=A0A8H4L4K2_9HYPO|nr:polyketide synthase [Fusarium albosuccineum]
MTAPSATATRLAIEPDQRYDDWYQTEALVIDWANPTAVALLRAECQQMNLANNIDTIVLNDQLQRLVIFLQELDRLTLLVGSLFDSSHGTNNLRKQIDKECDRDVSPQGFYHQLDRVGFSYGPAFARVSGLRTGHQSAVGTVTCADTACLMPLNFETSLKLHPATLDAMLHVGLCNVGGNQGDPTRVRTHVPTFVEEVSISEPMSQQPGDDFSVYTYGFDYEPMSRATRCSLVAFGPECEDPVIEIRGLKVFDVQEDSHKMASADAINPLTVDWQEDPAFIDFNSLAGWQDSVDGIEAAGEAEALRRQAYYLIKWALSAWESTPAQTPHLLRLRQWMETVVSDIETRSPESSEWTRFPEVERHDFVDQVAARSLQGHFNAQVGRHLPAIINGQADALDVIFRRDDGVWRIYEESIFFSRSNNQLAELVHRLSHQNPSLRILEVGAGTRGGTSKVLAALTRGDGERQYETFKRFDVSKDPIAQDFSASSYDLVIAADVLHATPNVENSLRYIRKLLKPDGVLAFVELSHFHIGLFPFATLPDWWHKDDGPIIQEDEWNKLLLKSGFTGVEAAISDFPGFGIHKLY